MYVMYTNVWHVLYIMYVIARSFKNAHSLKVTQIYCTSFTQNLLA